MHPINKATLLPIIFILSFHVGNTQTVNDPLTWRIEAPVGDHMVRGAASALRIKASIRDGWHVYGVGQPAGGPTPLTIALEHNAIAQARGRISTSAAIRAHDASFDLVTDVYTHDFNITLPMLIQKDAAFGEGTIPVSIHYQSCSNRTCMPPRTIHLNAPIRVVATME